MTPTLTPEKAASHTYPVASMSAEHNEIDMLLADDRGNRDGNIAAVNKRLRRNINERSISNERLKFGLSLSRNEIVQLWDSVRDNRRV